MNSARKNLSTDGKRGRVGSEAKFDSEKLRLSLVPTGIIKAIAQVREYGTKKYKDPDNWKNVEVERYKEACFRHWIKFIKDPKGVDEESRLPHIWHVACNVAFIIELMHPNIDDIKIDDCRANESHLGGVEHADCGWR